MDPQKISEDLQHRRQKVKEGPGYGQAIPQVKVDKEDIEKAMKDLNGVNEKYLEQYGFLTHVYRNAAKRTGTDISRIDHTGLFIKFE